MAIFTDNDVLTILRDQNPWWISGQVDAPLEKPFHRGEYYEASRVFHHGIRRFPVLSGLRRVGKSCILYQMISDLLRSGVLPIRILYVSLDTEVMTESGLLHALHLYRTTLNNDPEFYLFADEVQKDSDWSSVLKHIYDTFPSCKAIATGSASGKIEDKYRETGDGRLHLIKVPTLSFYEYCVMKGIALPETKTEDVFSLHLLSREEQAADLMKLSGLLSQMYSYLHMGGFPEYVKISPKDESYALSLIAENVINKAIYTDLAGKNVNPTQLKRVFTYLCNMTSNQLNVGEMCNQLGGISPITVEKYLGILENANLIYRSWPVRQDGKKALKAQAKVYIADAGVREAIVAGLHAKDDPVQLGYAVESAAYKHTVDYCKAKDLTWYVGYLRSEANQRRAGNEVDIAICNTGGLFQLVESKFRNRFPIREADLILKAALPDAPGYVITKEPDDFGPEHRENGSVYRIPAVAYLFLTGKMQHLCNRNP